MTNQQLRIKAENLVLLVTRYNLSTGAALELQKVAKSLHRLNENACNYGLTDRQETRQHNLYRKATELVSSGDAMKSLGFDDDDYEILEPTHFIREQRDPRGWPLEVSLEPMTDSQTYDYVCPF